MTSHVSARRPTVPYRVPPASKAIRHTFVKKNLPFFFMMFATACLTLQSPVLTICTTSLTLTNSTFCPHSVFMCFVWIWEQTAIISLYSINWLGFITETEVCLLRGTDCVFIYIFLYIQPSEFQLSIYVPPGLTFTNSALCPHSVLCGSQNKQRLFPYTALTDWFFL